MIDKSMIRKLSSAGVDPAVIINLMLDDDEAEQAAGADSAASEAQAAASEAQAAASEAQAAESKAAAQNTPAANNDQILAAIEKLTGAIQATNLRRDGLPGTETETAETILANLLHPQPKAK